MPITAEQRCAQLRRDNDTLRERVRQLEALLVPRLQLPLALGLTPAQERIVLYLFKRKGFASAGDIATAVEVQFDRHESSETTVRTYISKIRAVLRPHGVTILTRYGVGFSLTDDSKKRLAAIIEAGK
jgi:DNA-binding response OmpR family regulator